MVEDRLTYRDGDNEEADDNEKDWNEKGFAEEIQLLPHRVIANGGINRQFKRASVRDDRGAQFATVPLLMQRFNEAAGHMQLFVVAEPCKLGAVRSSVPLGVAPPRNGERFNTHPPISKSGSVKLRRTQQT
jgi:hypothetical protein